MLTRIYIVGPEAHGKTSLYRALNFHLDGNEYTYRKSDKIGSEHMANAWASTVLMRRPETREQDLEKIIRARSRIAFEDEDLGRHYLPFREIQEAFMDSLAEIAGFNSKLMSSLALEREDVNSTLYPVAEIPKNPRSVQDAAGYGGGSCPIIGLYDRHPEEVMLYNYALREYLNEEEEGPNGFGAFEERLTAKCREHKVADGIPHQDIYLVLTLDRAEQLRRMKMKKHPAGDPLVTDEFDEKLAQAYKIWISDLVESGAAVIALDKHQDGWGMGLQIKQLASYIFDQAYHTPYLKHWDTEYSEYEKEEFFHNTDYTSMTLSELDKRIEVDSNPRLVMVEEFVTPVGTAGLLARTSMKGPFPYPPRMLFSDRDMPLGYSRCSARTHWFRWSIKARAFDDMYIRR